MNLRVENIKKDFVADQGVHVVLDNISFTVNEGQFVTLLGPSGCGKTTLLSIIAGFQTATAGQISINGRKVTKPGAGSGICLSKLRAFSLDDGERKYPVSVTAPKDAPVGTGGASTGAAGDGAVGR